MSVRFAMGVLLVGILFPALPVPAGDNPRWHSEEWYQQRSMDPPGARQVEKYGKQWPPFSRPVGPGQTFWHKYHHAHYWPYPYNYEDRDFVNGAMQLQANNGWEVATTLHDYHFDSETHRLNSAGEVHLRWILLQAPTQYRTTYISRGVNDAVNQIRLAQVQESARSIVGDTLPPILLRNDAFLGRPAIEIDTLRRMELQATVQPRLFVIGTGGGSSSAPSSSQAGGATGTANNSN